MERGNSLVRGLAIFVSLACSTCLAGDPAPHVDSILGKWEKASQECQSFDAQVIAFHYDKVFASDDRPTVTRGRFYYEAPNTGCYYKTSEDDSGKSNSSRLWPSIIWKGDQTLLIDAERRKCERFPSARLLKLKVERPQTPAVTEESRPSGFLGDLVNDLARSQANALAQLQRSVLGPREFLPLVLDVHAAEVKERFRLTLEHAGDEVRLKAIPTHPSDQVAYSEVGVILNAKTYMTHAIQLVSPNGKVRVVYVFEDERINQRPEDREDLLNPKLFGFAFVDVAL